MPGFTSRCVINGALKTQLPFVYKALVMLMTLFPNIVYFIIDHTQRHKNAPTPLRICACTRLREMKQTRDSTFYLSFIRGDNKGNVIILPVILQSVCTYTHVHKHAQDEHRDAENLTEPATWHMVKSLENKDHFNVYVWTNLLQTRECIPPPRPSGHQIMTLSEI